VAGDFISKLVVVVVLLLVLAGGVLLGARIATEPRRVEVHLYVHRPEPLFPVEAPNRSGLMMRY